MEIAAAVIVTALVTLLLTVVGRNFISAEKRVDYQIAPVTSDEPAFRRCLGHLLGPPLLGGNRIECLLNGKRIFPAMLEAIRSAERTITFETYIYWTGKIGQEFSQALAERARAGVRVHVLLDWLGSNKLDPHAIEEMIDAGVQVERYHKPHWYSLSRINNRTHRKLMVVDGRVGFIGGVGVADMWLGDAESPEHWRDTHFKVEGPVVADLQAAFMDNWIKTREDVLNSEAYFPELTECGSTWAQVFKSSPREGASSVRLLFVLAISAARQRLLIANSYFVPDDHSINALIEARRRGVEVEIIVPGEYIDTKITRRASRSRWGRLLEAGVKIYEFQPTMYHCKVMVVDDDLVSVGSTNFDNRSFRLNDEANLNILDADLANEQAEIFERDKARSRLVTLEQWQRRPWREKAVEWAAGLLRSQV